MSNGVQPKPLFWMRSSRKDLKNFPLAVRRTMGFALFQAQTGGKHVDAKPLRGFGGAGVLEIVQDDDGSAFRAVYTVKFAGAVYVLHAFQKKSKKGVKTPKTELDLIRTRLKAAEEHYETWRSAQEDEEADERNAGRRG
jgi:phage-related protein